MTDMPDWQVPAALTRGSKSIGTATASALLGGASTDLVSAEQMQQPAFEMLIGLEYPPTGTTIPFGRLKFLWQDSASGTQVDPDWCIVPGGLEAMNFCYITGPAKADTLTIELDNLDPAEILSYTFGTDQVSFTPARFMAEEVGGQAVPVYTRAAFSNQMGIVGSTNVNLGGGSTQDRLAETWGGKAIIAVDNLGGAAAVWVRLLDPGVSAGGAPLYGVANSGIIFGATVAAGGWTVQEVALPYGPVVIREINQSATTAVAPTTTITRAP